MIEREKEGKGFNFFHFMIDLEGGPCVMKRMSGCGSGTEYLSVTPWGDLYPCHQFVGQEEFLMGNVDDGIVKPEIADDFRSCSVYSKEKCKNCFAKFYCSGGCMANSYNFHGTIHDCYDVGCEMQRSYHPPYKYLFREEQSGRNPMIRLFAGIELPDHIKDQLYAFGDGMDWMIRKSCSVLATSVLYRFPSLNLRLPD